MKRNARGDNSRVVWMNHNDPSAGSPTETLLRLLLPLNNLVCKFFILLLYFIKTSLYPNKSPTYSIGRSDGRCVQKAGTYSKNVDDILLLDIPGLHIKFQDVIPNISKFHDFSALFE